MNFGYSYLLDMWGCEDGICDSLEVHYRFLETLVERIGMTAMCPPKVQHAPRVNGVEMYPDKEGVSGCIFLIESGITIHSMEPSHEIYLDVFSCKLFDPLVVRDVAFKHFRYLGYKDHWIERRAT